MAFFEHLVTTESELRALVGGTPSERAQLKERSGLDQQSRAFIALSPFLLMATSGSDGTCDVSPRGDAPDAVGEFKHRMSNQLGGSLRKLKLTTLSEELTKHVNQAIRSAETAAEARQLV